ncbi:winged helix-turn-helix transcriptional regulator [Rhizobium sp. KVB221]|uniref:Winged helix-turn-helix transcriptional regulator n=1 Tax=Rhizobium setariae TaxID=2801340 RepID=A0A936YVP3_9HYPH|nr:MarR family winged helix-turn-helix transcriptional regulator [Rhizobium setariae]MBL0374671.1 winged helix-turn-helix transcriptional regulator [Rhizobium setariae]
MPSKANPDSFGFVFTETSRLLRTALERRIAAVGLDVTPAEARALVYVAAAEGSRQNVIAERMGVEPMTVCAYLDKLEKLGLVERNPDPKDRRAKNVTTTEAADRLIVAVREQSAALYEEIQSGLDEQARDIFFSAMKTVRGNLHSLLSDKPQPHAGGETVSI